VKLDEFRKQCPQYTVQKLIKLAARRELPHARVVPEPAQSVAGTSDECTVRPNTSGADRRVGVRVCN
jgi:hypothetical protein